MALQDLTVQKVEFAKIGDKCGETLEQLKMTYSEAQREMDAVYEGYCRQLESARKTAKEALQTFMEEKRTEMEGLQKVMHSAVRTLSQCEGHCRKEFESGNGDNIAQIVQSQMKAIKLPESMDVPSGKFMVEYAKMAVHPPVLQPEEVPFYRPVFDHQRGDRVDRDEVSSHSSRRSKSSHASQHSKGSTNGSLTDMIDPKLIGGGHARDSLISPDHGTGGTSAVGMYVVYCFVFFEQDF